jgi:methylated-DNA-[protein]-cysteine S-methyltransferase
MSHTSLPTPLGYLRISGDADAITEVAFLDDDPGQSEFLPDCLLTCRLQLQEYFAGIRRTFDVPLKPSGTSFQQQVWEELVGIPFGALRSYKDVALTRWNDKTIRAVGTANGQNPIAVIIPCHRVIGSAGDLTGYAAGLWRKKWLLEHENSVEYGKQGTLF